MPTTSVTPKTEQVEISKITLIPLKNKDERRRKTKKKKEKVEREKEGREKKEDGPHYPFKGDSASKHLDLFFLASCSIFCS